MRGPFAKRARACFRYASRVSAEFAKAGARGITIISGSGDGGVEGAQPRACPGGKFVPTFPCASPFETCVGGTPSESRTHNLLIHALLPARPTRARR